MGVAAAVDEVVVARSAAHGRGGRAGVERVASRAAVEIDRNGHVGLDEDRIIALAGVGEDFRDAHELLRLVAERLDDHAATVAHAHAEVLAAVGDVAVGAQSGIRPHVQGEHAGVHAGQDGRLAATADVVEVDQRDGGDVPAGLEEGDEAEERVEADP